MAEKKQKVVDESKLIERAKANFRLAYDFFKDLYEEMIDDLSFIIGKNQWPIMVKQARTADNRPCLVINKLPQFVDRVQGDLRKSRPRIKIRPVDDKADEETADIIGGIVRNVENISDAEMVYDSGGEAMAQCGFGAWRVLTDYISEDTFDQEILIRRIKNQFGVLLDPAAKMWDRSDGRFSWIYEDIPRTEFERRYPKKFNFPISEGGKDYGDWAKEDTIRIGEYIERELEEKEIFLVSTRDNPQPHTVYEMPEGEEDNDFRILKRRKVKQPIIWWYKLSGRQILEGPTRIPGKLIPIVPIYGKEVIINGHSHYYGIVRHAKDSQRLYNYFRSMDAETQALAPRAPWLVTSAMIAQHQKMWDSAHMRNYPYLVFTPDPNVAGAFPQRNVAQVNSQGAVQNIMMADQELHDTTGLQLASLGKKSNEQSGKAIENRTKESEIGQFTYSDNQMRAIKHTARIVVGMIPFVIDNARVQRIIGEDKKTKNVKVNQRFQDEQGEDKVFDLTAGTYDVVASVGPSYETQRQESVAAMLEFANLLNDQQRTVTADLIVDSSDWHGADRMSRRLKKLLPDGILDPDEMEEDGSPQQPPTPSPEEIKAQAIAEAQIEREQMIGEAELQIKKADVKKAEAQAAEAEAKAAIAEAEATQAGMNFRKSGANVR